MNPHEAPLPETDRQPKPADGIQDGQEHAKPPRPPTTAFLIFVRAHARASEKWQILDAVRRGCEEDGVDVLNFDVVMTVTE